MTLLETNDMTRRRKRARAPKVNTELEKLRFDKPAGVRRLVEVKVACRYGRMSPATLYRLMKQKRILGYKDGRYTKIDLNSMDAYHNSLPLVVLR